MNPGERSKPVNGRPDTVTVACLCFIVVFALVACTGKQGGNTAGEQHSVPQAKQVSLDTNNTQIHTLAFSPDGTQLAGITGGFDGPIIRLWNVQTGTVVQTIKADGVLDAVAFSPDGKLVAAAGGYFGGSGGHLQWWDVQTGQSRQSTGLWQDLLGRGVAFSPDGKLLATGGRDGKVSFWDVTSGKKTKALKALPGVVSFVAFLPNDVLLASGTSGKAVMKPRPDDPKWSTLTEFGETALLNLSTGKVARSLPTTDNDTARYRVAFSHDGNVLATRGPDDVIEIWNGPTGQVTKSLKGSKGEVHTLAISPDGQTLASAGADKIIRIWNIQTGANDSSLTGHEATVTSVVFSPDGTTLASASDDKTVRLWKLK
jgi:WD40 repeat protein